LKSEVKKVKENNMDKKDKKQTEKSKKSTKKDRKKKGYFLPKTAFEWICDIIILGCVVVMLVLVIPPVVKNVKNKQEAAKQQKELEEAEAKKTPEPTATPIPDYIEIYEQNIETTEQANDTLFTLEFNTEEMTFEDRVTVGDMSDSLDDGVYEKTDEGLKTISTEDEKVTKYIEDGDYLIVKDSLYDGKVPEDADKTFDKQFTYKNKESLIYRQLNFDEDGKFTLVKAALTEDYEIDNSKSSMVAGTYEFDGQFIHLNEESDGSTLLDYYVYDNKITNAYYKKRTE